MAEKMRVRRNVAAGSPWEPMFGYSRAVRVGNLVYVAGTTAVDEDGKIVGPNDPYAQTVQTLRNVRASLQAAGADLNHVVRTRIYVINIDHWDQVARAHLEVFQQIRPAATMVEVSRLISPEMLVEIEADAVIE